ncbi:hypothetical protein GCM10009837_55360 [Streptomyces durmitorensis]
MTGARPAERCSGAILLPVGIRAELRVGAGGSAEVIVLHRRGGGGGIFRRPRGTYFGKVVFWQKGGARIA